MTTGPGGRRIGVDLGGTKIEGMVLDADGRTIMRERIATQRERGYEHILDRVAVLTGALRRAAPEATVIGIGTPGAVSSRTGRMKNCNTTCLNGRDLGKDLADRLGIAVRIENDANLFALAESVAGAGRGATLVFGVIIGTGVGGGLVYGGQLWRGPQRLAGEWGHHSIDPAGPQCYCGARGCVETFLAGPRIEERYAADCRERVPMAEIVARRRRGEAAASRVFADFLGHFGRALANVIDIVDPDVVVLGGGLSNIEELYGAGRDAVAARVFNDELRTPIVPNQLGDSAGVIGAALLAGREEAVRAPSASLTKSPS